MAAARREETARQRAESAGQGHLFAAWDRLDAREQAGLVEAVEGLDFELVAELAALLERTPESRADVRLDPPELFPLARTGELAQRAAQARDAGAELLRTGKVGYLLVAGGQASRLGHDGPKGGYGIGPVSGWTLFEIHARRLRAARARYGCPTPWYVMTSRANHAQTVLLFERNEHFGVPRDEVVFFTQDMVPAVDFEGRILMSGPAEPFLAPNGHGGSIAALATSGALADARARGLEQLSYFQVDNPLARPADALFLGLHELAGAGMSSKVVAKRGPHEKVGVLGRIDGRMGCIEYSDLSPELRDRRDADGQLSFRAGNIAIHALRLEFLERLAGGAGLPWHVARKEMKTWSPEGPVLAQGAKFETFVFDALGRSQHSVTLEVDRAEEFSPVKNAAGEDSPESSRRDLCRLFAGWVRDAGHPLPEVEVAGEPAVEVDPLLAEDRETFLAHEGLEPEATPRGHLYR